MNFPLELIYIVQFSFFFFQFDYTALWYWMTITYVHLLELHPNNKVESQDMGLSRDQFSWNLTFNILPVTV